MPRNVWGNYINGPTSLPISQLPADMMARRITGSRRPLRRNGHGLRGPEEDFGFDTSELMNGPKSLEYPDIPIDMYPRIVENYQRNPDGSLSPVGDGTQDPMGGLLSRIANDTGVLASTAILRRGLLGRTVTVTTVPELIINAEYLRGYIILNPNELAGATSAGTLLASAARTLTGTSAALGVANFISAHYYLDITAIVGGGNLTITLETLDPVTGNWATSQVIFSAIAATGTYYAYVGEQGTATDARISYSVSVGSTITFSVGFVLKNGLIGTSSGISQTIYLGGPGVTTTSGFPLLNGQNQRFFLQENLQLWAVANATLPLKIFEL